MKNFLNILRNIVIVLTVTFLFVSCWSLLPESKCESTVNGAVLTGVC